MITEEIKDTAETEEGSKETYTFVSDEELAKQMEQPKNLKEMIDRNSQEFIEKKESMYDKMIDSSKITEKGLDIFIVIMALVGIAVFVIGFMNRG